ncbi:adenine deaminase [Elasticomyces elasticus]|nr:adenine deaminase [Elasticomyces elasticus]
MCKSELHSFLQQLPKCEHHLHLEGALTPQLLFSLAAKNHIQLPKDDPAYASPEALVERYRKFDSLDDFLGYYYIGMSVLLHAEDFEALAWDYFGHAASDGVLHAEVFFDPLISPSKHTQAVGSPTMLCTPDSNALVKELKQSWASPAS